MANQLPEVERKRPAMYDAGDPPICIRCWGSSSLHQQCCKDIKSRLCKHNCSCHDKDITTASMGGNMTFDFSGLGSYVLQADGSRKFVPNPNPTNTAAIRPSTD